jgi:hypothetical protein
MAVKASQFLAVVLTALALLPGGAHLMALPAKLAMPEQPYFVAQQVYRGWAWAGVVIFLAIFANFAAAFLTHGRRRQLFTVAGLLIGTTLALFFVWTYPANEATGNWTSVPENWEQLRIQWEYSHAVNAALTFLALLCAVGAALSIDSRHETYGRNLSEEATEAQDQLTAQNTPRLEHVASKSMAADKIVYTSPSPQAQSRRMR